MKRTTLSRIFILQYIVKIWQRNLPVRSNTRVRIWRWKISISKKHSFAYTDTAMHGTHTSMNRSHTPTVIEWNRNDKIVHFPVWEQERSERSKRNVRNVCMQKLDREHENTEFFLCSLTQEREKAGNARYSHNVYDSEKYVFHAHHIVAILLDYTWHRTHYGYPQDNQQSVFKLPIYCYYVNAIKL